MLLIVTFDLIQTFLVKKSIRSKYEIDIFFSKSKVHVIDEMTLSAKGFNEIINLFHWLSHFWTNHFYIFLDKESVPNLLLLILSAFPRTNYLYLFIIKYADDRFPMHTNLCTLHKILMFIS
uniref:Uncharacterized protein n=1 Tax=Cacopsylla melanoneura TaxID=428564 RepID=A0A8D8UYU6_9HEMI